MPLIFSSPMFAFWLLLSVVFFARIWIGQLNQEIKPDTNNTSARLS
jgi:hypothetical protein